MLKRGQQQAGTERGSMVVENRMVPLRSRSPPPPAASFIFRGSLFAPPVMTAFPLYDEQHQQTGAWSDGKKRTHPGAMAGVPQCYMNKVEGKHEGKQQDKGLAESEAAQLTTASASIDLTSPPLHPKPHRSPPVDFLTLDAALDDFPDTQLYEEESQKPRSP